MIIAVEEGKAFEKFSTHLRKQTLRKLGVEGNFLDREYVQNPTAKIIYNRGCFPTVIRSKARMSTLTAVI